MKSRLRHPITAIREPFGKAGLIVACLALVFAMAGGALAAKGALTGKQKKEVAKIAQKEAKKYAGKNGKNGATGPAGPAGPAGAAGSKGDKGDPGTNGSNGSNGTNGNSVKVVGNASEAECPAGGKLYEVEGSGAKNKVCNGETGFTETLPSEKTETGTWASGAVELELGTVEAAAVPVSFNIPLAAGTQIPAHAIQNCGELEEALQSGCETANKGSEEAGCTGTVAEPTAPAGVLCVYTAATAGAKAAIFNIIPSNTNARPEHRAGPYGAVILLGETSEGGFGTWAVTAE
jgi:Collagen triple helix repeat (20 copies)